MKMLVIALCLIAAATAAPAAPCEDPKTTALRRQPALQHEETRDEFGQYAFRYVTAEGTIVSQRGHLVPSPDGCGEVLVIEGETSYIGDDGKTYTTKYTAGLDGNHVEGAHLPVSVPVPDVPAGEGARRPEVHIDPSNPGSRKNPCAKEPSIPVAKRDPCVEVVPSVPVHKRDPCVEVVPSVPVHKRDPCVEVVPSIPVHKRDPCVKVEPSIPAPKKEPCVEVAPSTPAPKKDPCVEVVPSIHVQKKNPCREVAPSIPAVQRRPCPHKKHTCE